MKRLTITTITSITIVLLYLLINVLASIAWAEIDIAGILATCLLLLGLAALFGGQTAITVLAFQRGFAWGGSEFDMDWSIHLCLKLLGRR